MRYWVQYHNFEKVNSLPEGEFGISTDKEDVLTSIGDTIFLIVGIGESPKQFLLWEQFICEEVFDNGEPPWQYSAFGDGWFLDQSRRNQTLLNRRTGFHDYLRWAQNFRVGFHEITDHPFLETLLKVSERCKPKSVATSKAVKEDASVTSDQETSQQVPNSVEKKNKQTPLASKTTEDTLPTKPENSSDNGAGFGNAVSNQQVEQAAINFVSRHFEAEGWAVTSVEAQKCGYDLSCTNGSDELQVEVKGISGDGKQFIITSNEASEAQKCNPEYRLAVVNRATSETPGLSIYTAEEFSKAFELRVISYAAMPKTASRR
ncbi:hypothetical protein Lepto7375DRAFT_0019 [Leptolyngbya sp. PCC 7375]|nr:hypothetical protein Lepto7375DRAFT_0019 [Leptolyngbya sp. PCC 7375]